MVEGIQSIHNENYQALRSTYQDLNTILNNLAEGLRGKSNNTIINDWKNRIHRPTAETAEKNITPYEQGLLLENARHLPRVKKGAFRINNTYIDVDPSKDTFTNIVEKITASSEGITARYDANNDRFIIASEGSEGKIHISKDTSNFLREMDIDLGLYYGSTESPDFASMHDERKRASIVSDIEQLARKNNQLLSKGVLTQKAQNDIEDTWEKTIVQNEITSPNLSRYYLPWGLDVHLREDTEKPFNSVTETLFQRLRHDSADIVHFFTGSESTMGLVDSMQETIANASKNNRYVQIMENNKSAASILEETIGYAQVQPRQEGMVKILYPSLGKSDERDDTYKTLDKMTGTTHEQKTKNSILNYVINARNAVVTLESGSPIINMIL